MTFPFLFGALVRLTLPFLVAFGLLLDLVFGGKDGRSLGSTDGRVDGPVLVLGFSLGSTDGRVDGLTLGSTDGRIDGLTLGSTDGRVDGLVDGLVDGRVDGLSLGSTDGLSLASSNVKI